MLQKKFWIPILLVLIGVGIGGTFWGKHIASQAPETSITPVAVEKQIAPPKPPPPGESYETGHWHGDEWHAEPHEPLVEDVPVEDYRDVELEAYEASLSHFTDEERATYDRALTGEIVRHREKYPDCQDHEAVFEDADRFARWWVKYKKYCQIEAAALADFDAVALEILALPTDYRRMTDVEKQALIAKARDLHQRNEEASKRIDEIHAQEPVHPKPRHTH